MKKIPLSCTLFFDKGGVTRVVFPEVEDMETTTLSLVGDVVKKTETEKTRRVFVDGRLQISETEILCFA